jgi:hypothetical protein
MIATRTWFAAVCLLCCLGAACGEDDGRPAGDGVSDAGEEGDAGSDPGCEPTPEFPIAWTRQLPRTANAIAFDRDGSIVVSLHEEPSSCVRLMRLAADGTEIWRHRYDPSPVPAENYKPCPNSWDALALAADGAIVTVSDEVHLPDAAGPTDILLRKHDPEGSAIWTYYNQNAPDGFEGRDAAGDVAVASDGVIVAAGEHASRPWVARFAPDGTNEWIRLSTGTGAKEVESSVGGGFYVGITTGETEGPELRIARFDPDGSETTIGGVPQISRDSNVLAATSDGGLVFLLDRGVEPRLRKIDTSGDIVWERLLDFTVRDSECGVIPSYTYRTIAIGPDGSIYLSFNGFVARVSAEGEYLSSHFYGHLIETLAVGPDGSLAFIDRRDLVVTHPLD